MIPLLIKAGADVNSQNNWKYTPLGIAYAKNHFYSAHVLMDDPRVEVNVKNDKG
jgi:hypothetical protein